MSKTMSGAKQKVKQALRGLAAEHTIISAAQANAAGISNVRLCQLVEEGELERVAHGVYLLAGEFDDDMYIYQLRRKDKAIYSHTTALSLHDLTTRDPLRYTVTVPTGYNSKILKQEKMRVFTVRPELHSLGKIQMKTKFGNFVNVYNMERTICDCLRSRNHLDGALIFEGLREYVKRRDIDTLRLRRMAEIFQVDKLLRTYLQVLI